MKHALIGFFDTHTQLDKANEGVITRIKRKIIFQSKFLTPGAM